MSKPSRPKCITLHFGYTILTSWLSRSRPIPCNHSRHSGHLAKTHASCSRCKGKGLCAQLPASHNKNDNGRTLILTDTSMGSHSWCTQPRQLCIFPGSGVSRHALRPVTCVVCLDPEYMLCLAGTLMKLKVCTMRQRQQAAVASKSIAGAMVPIAEAANKEQQQTAIITTAALVATLIAFLVSIWTSASVNSACLGNRV